jgi:phosphoenolpyruvate synthase/pyruvate phosphate dikinase
VLTNEAAVRLGEQGKEVILVREETSPEDVDGMHKTQAILTSKGGMTSHAALVARSWGKCCIVGCSEIDIAHDGKSFKTKKGDVIKGGRLDHAERHQGSRLPGRHGPGGRRAVQERVLQGVHEAGRRRARPFGICGEHGGDADSVKFCHEVGMSYVSCSPFRVPIARLAAAQAQIENPRSK